MPKGPDANVFVATAAEASHGATGVRAGNGSGAELDNIDVEGIRALHCVLLGYADDPGVLRRHKRVYTWTESNGPWLDECPAEFVSALAAIQPEHFREVGLRWWERLWEEDEEDIRAEMLSQAPADSLAHAVGVFVSLARSAIRQGKNLYWVVPGC